MAQLYITTRGLREFRMFTRRFPMTMDNYSDEGMTQIAKNVQKSAKLRAPRFTGFLADQITVTKTKKNHLSVHTGEAYYAGFQEFGFKPHFIPRAWFARHMTAPGVPAGAQGRLSADERKKGWAYVSKHKPFIRPALAVQLPRVLPIMINKVHQAVRKARR